MATSPPAPLGLALIVCDQIIEDKLTHKKSLIGIFNQIGSSNFPCRHPRLAVFAALTEGRGECPVQLCIAHEETGQVVARVNGQIRFPDVHAVVELNFDLVGLVFPTPGLYSLEFYCDELLILERRFHVIQIKSPSSGSPPASA